MLWTLPGLLGRPTPFHDGGKVLGVDIVAISCNSFPHLLGERTPFVEPPLRPAPQIHSDTPDLKEIKVLSNEIRE